MAGYQFYAAPVSTLLFISVVQVNSDTNTICHMAHLPLALPSIMAGTEAQPQPTFGPSVQMD